MFSLSRIQFSKFAAMGSLVVLSTLGTPTRADELGQSSLPQFHTGPIAIGELDASITRQRAPLVTNGPV